jgi:hypothetical protein
MPPSRPLAAAITAGITILALTAGSGNPYLFDHVLARRTNNDQVIGAAARTLGAFTWRTHSNPPLLTTALWVGQLVAIAVLAVLTFFFVALLARGATKAVSVFVGTWAAVVLATVVTVIIRAILWYPDFFNPLDDQGRMGRIGYALFKAPSAPAIMYGFYAGIVTALVTALVFALVRRRAERRADAAPAGADAAGYPPPGYGYGDFSGAGAPPNYPGPEHGPSSDQVTAVLPPTGPPTRHAPGHPDEPARAWGPEPHWDAPAGDEPTRQLPTDRPADPDAPTGRFG